MVMKEGELVETGLTDQVLDDPQQPYTQLLVSSVLPA
jgi:putative phosphonate transport system ATP-binding protein